MLSLGVVERAVRAEDDVDGIVGVREQSLSRVRVLRRRGERGEHSR